MSCQQRKNKKYVGLTRIKEQIVYDDNEKYVYEGLTLVWAFFKALVKNKSILIRNSITSLKRDSHIRPIEIICHKINTNLRGPISWQESLSDWQDEPFLHGVMD